MRFRQVTGAVPHDGISNSVVIVDDYHARIVGLSVLGTNCEIVDSLSKVDDRGPRVAIATERDSITLVDTRPERVQYSLQTLNDVFRSSEMPQVNIVTKRLQVHGFIEALNRGSHTDDFAVIGITYTDNCAVLALAPSEHTDRPLTDFLEGYRSGLNESTEQEPQTEACRECVDLKQKVASLIEAAALTVKTASDVPPPEVQPSVKDGSDNAELLKAQKRVTELTTERDILARKYESLASSRLGKTALKYWAWRRKGGSRNG